jgi:hypothetical protein
MRVSLFVTGKMEYVALPAALTRLFEGHEFECVRYKPSAGEQHFPSFTSSRLPKGPITPGVRSNIDVLVQMAAAEVVDRRGHEPPDLLVILDDLELDNADQPEVVVECFRAAVSDHLGKLGPHVRDRTQSRLRERASLHLAAPMIESWLFADPGGMARVGVPTLRCTAPLPCAPKFEDFLTDDTAYLEDDCSSCVQWAAVQAGRSTKEKRKAHQPEWCTRETSDRCRHPKRYLAWLCRDPEAKKCSTYREASSDPRDQTGATSLRDLDWSAILPTVANMPFLGALIDDLANGLGEDNPLPAGATLAAQTRVKHQSSALLRNI